MSSVSNICHSVKCLLNMATLSLGGEMRAEAQMWGSVMQRWGEMTQLPLDEHLRALMQTRYVFHCNLHGDPEIDIISSTVQIKTCRAETLSGFFRSSS